MAKQNNSGATIIDDKDQFLLPLGRLQWEALFVPKQFETGTPKYNLTLFFDNDADFSAYKAAQQRLMNLPEAKKLAVQPGSEEEKKAFASGLTADDITYTTDFLKGLQKPIKKETDLDQLERNPYLAGKLVAKMTSAFPPVVVDGAKRPITKANKDQVYRGCYGYALVSLGIHNKDKMFLRLKGFQKTRDGEPLFTSSTNVDLFESFTDESSLAENDDI
jgi:hypothetical protein